MPAQPTYPPDKDDAQGPNFLDTAPTWGDPITYDDSPTFQWTAKYGAVVLENEILALISGATGDKNLGEWYAHSSLTVGMAVRQDPSNDYTVLQANSTDAAHARVLGFITAISAVDPTTCWVQFATRATTLSGLTRGGYVYLKDDGSFGATPGTVSTIVGVAVSATDAVLTTSAAAGSGGGLVDLTTGVTGVLPVANGGTNSSTSLTNHKVMVSTSGAISELSSAGISGQVLTSNGSSSSPSFQAIPSTSLTSGVTGVLPIANGGTNSSSALTGNKLIGTTSSSYLELSNGTSGQVLTSNGPSSLPSMQNLPTYPSVANNVVAFTPTDQSVISSTTLVDETYMQFSIGSGEIWGINYYLFLQTATTAAGSSGGDWKIALQGPSSPTAFWMMGESGWITGTPTVITYGSPLEVQSFPYSSFGWAAGPVTVIKAFVWAGISGGTVKLQYAQWSSHAENNTIKKGSYMLATKLN